MLFGKAPVCSGAFVRPERLLAGGECTLGGGSCMIEALLEIDAKIQLSDMKFWLYCY